MPASLIEDRILYKTNDSKAFMIPRKIHYCWFGRGPMPELALNCIESWHKFMPDYEYRLWNEDNFDISYNQYVKEAYSAKMYAFVSDVARLKVLAEEGGIYLDVDFEVFKPFDNLLGYKAFAGFEGSKTRPVMMGIIASEANGLWVSEQLDCYKYRSFIVNGKPDLTTNVRFITDNMIAHGFNSNGKEQDYKDLHIFPAEYFCPQLTSGEYIRTDHTFCEHRGSDSSWARKKLKSRIVSYLPSSLQIVLIKTKRKLFG